MITIPLLFYKITPYRARVNSLISHIIYLSYNCYLYHKNRIQITVIARDKVIMRDKDHIFYICLAYEHPVKWIFMWWDVFFTF